MSRLIRVTKLGSRGHRPGYLPFSQSTVWRTIQNDPTFPRPFGLGPRVSVIDADELDAWLAKKREVAHDR